MPIRRKKKELSAALEKRLASYTLASAVGISCAFATGSNAAVVYTSVKDIREPSQEGVPVYALIDLNHDGQTDFAVIGSFFNFFGTAGIYRSALVVCNAEPGNEVGVPASGLGAFHAEALSFGKEIGPNLDFSGGNFNLAGAHSVGFGPQSGFGEFYDQRNKFVALKLSVQGKTYYGWARMSTQVSNPSNFTFELVDYAYQSTPNVPILAGQGITRPEAAFLDAPGAGPLEMPSGPRARRHPASLGMLAYGFQALPSWRAEKMPPSR